MQYKSGQMGTNVAVFLLVFIMPKVKNKKISNLTTWRSYMILVFGGEKRYMEEFSFKQISKL
jgi:hypothetical protein